MSRSRPCKVSVSVLSRGKNQTSRSRLGLVELQEVLGLGLVSDQKPNVLVSSRSRKLRSRLHPCYEPYRAVDRLLLSCYDTFVQTVVKDGSYSDMLLRSVASFRNRFRPGGRGTEHRSWQSYDTTCGEARCGHCSRCKCVMDEHGPK